MSFNKKLSLKKIDISKLNTITGGCHPGERTITHTLGQCKGNKSYMLCIPDGEQGEN